MEKTLFSSGLGLKSAVVPALARDHRHPLMDRLRADPAGVRRGRVTLRLARAAGFCYGVERAVQYAYETREAFPDRRVFLASPLIHNPQVHARLADMGIHVLRLPSADEDLGPADVVIVPAFGLPLDRLAALRASGAVLVDTTCGSVMLVWKSVARLVRDGFTVVLHGNPAHEETRATLSRVEAAGGRWIVVRDVAKAELLAACVRGGGSVESGGAPPTACSPPYSSLATLHSPQTRPPAASAGSPALARLGLAHQTTMLASESRAIAEILRRAVRDRWGEAALADRFRDFDTICTATQERQDAVEALGRAGVDLFLVVGGRDSHNTAHLAEVAARFAPAWHVEGPEDLGPWTSPGCFSPGPLVIGLAAGASTPDAVTGAVAERVLELAGGRSHGS